MTRIANQDFTLLRDDCRPLYIKAGDTIPAEYATHWFVLLHTDAQAIEAAPTEDDKPKVGRPKKS